MVSEARAEVVTGLALVGLLAALGTAVAYAPHLFRDGSAYDADPTLLSLVWLALLVVLGPTIAAVTSLRWPVATTTGRALLVGLPQVVLAVLLVRLDVWSEVRSGYLLPGSGEEAMSYWVGGFVSVIAGLVLMLLVAAAARAGARTGSRRRPGDDDDAQRS